MKIRQISDLHLEFPRDNYYVTRLESDKETILILAGDINTKNNAFPFLEELATLFYHVIYILGNHEFYKSTIKKVTEAHIQQYKDHYNIHFLNNDSIIIDGVRFIGSTLWTNFNKEDPISIWDCRRSINDFHIIRSPNGKGYKLMPYEVIKLYNQNKEYIFNCLNEDMKIPTVVITHHAPSSLSILEKYKNNVNINGAYYSELFEDIIRYDNIKYWFHGHMHDNLNYMIGNTNVICNPKGYIIEPNPDFDDTIIHTLGV